MIALTPINPLVDVWYIASLQDNPRFEKVYLQFAVDMRLANKIVSDTRTLISTLTKLDSFEVSSPAIILLDTLKGESITLKVSDTAEELIRAGLNNTILVPLGAPATNRHLFEWSKKREKLLREKNIVVRGFAEEPRQLREDSSPLFETSDSFENAFNRLIMECVPSNHEGNAKREVEPI